MIPAAGLKGVGSYIHTVNGDTYFGSRQGGRIVSRATLNGQPQRIRYREKSTLKFQHSL